MINPQEFYIQHLGIGSIWKLRQINEESDNVDYNDEKIISELDAKNKNRLKLVDSLFDILVLRSNNITSSDFEQLCENVVQAMRYGNQFDVSFNKSNFSEQEILFEQLIHISGVRVIACFEPKILQKMRQFLEDSHNKIIETSHQEAFLLNGFLCIQFHSFEEMINNPLLKKDTWEKICLLQNHLHST